MIEAVLYLYSDWMRWLRGPHIALFSRVYKLKVCRATALEGADNTVEA